MNNKKQIVIAYLSMALLVWIAYGRVEPEKEYFEDTPITERASLRSFNVDVKTIGELEAARSITVSSSVKGDLGKIIYLIKDGTHVQPGDLLVKMDPTPFEERITECKAKIKEQKAVLAGCKRLCASEKAQVEHEKLLADYDVEAAELEYKKIISGDGPAEIGKLKSAVQKAKMKFDELEGYSKDLVELEQQGYVNSLELDQIQKKVEEEREAYENALQQYECYVDQVLPMQIKKAESNIRRAKLKLDETEKSGNYKIAKAEAALEQALQYLEDLNFQLKNEEKELAYSEIRAPSPGIVVLREEFRMSQKRKPLVGDIAIKNQALIDLPDLQSLLVKTKVREIDLHKISVGKQVTIEIDAYPQLKLTGKVHWIGVLASTDYTRPNSEKFFEAKIFLDSVDPRLRPGMTVRATIHAAEVENKLSIPFQSVFTEDKQNYIYLKKWRGFCRRNIEIGNYNEQWVEVVEGLTSGDEVCLTYPLGVEK